MFGKKNRGKKTRSGGPGGGDGSSSSNSSSKDGRSGPDTPSLSRKEKKANSKIEARIEKEVSNRISTAKDTNLLDLQSSGLSSLPPKVASLSDLKTLNLSLNVIDDLPSAFGDLTCLTSVKLNGNHLKTLPDLSKLSHLESFDVGKNLLTSFPSTICSLSALKKLVVCCNTFGSLPDNFGSLSSLTYLDASSCKLSSLPPSISSCGSIKTLDLSYNLFKELPPAISALSSLTTLSLSSNKLSELPNEICKLAFLQTLSADSNRLSTLPARFNRLDSLTKLELQTNKFRKIPPPLLALRSLVELDVSENKLKKIPRALSSLQELATIRLHGNQFTTIPAEISKMSVLMELGLTRNAIARVPPELGQMEYLGKLILPKNNLSVLPEPLKEMKFLEELNVSGNQITHFPLELCVLERMKTLNLSSNKITTLPEDIGSLIRLVSIDVSENSLTAIPDGITKCNRVQEIIAFSNQIMALPSKLRALKHLHLLSFADNWLTQKTVNEAFDTSPEETKPGQDPPFVNLEMLYLSGNALNVLPSGVCQISGLIELFASRNAITELPDLSSLSRLRMLDLGGNKLKVLPPSIGKCTSLREINLSFNELSSLPSSLKNCSMLQCLWLAHNEFTSFSKDFHKFKSSVSYIDAHDNPTPVSVLLKSTPDAWRFQSGLEGERTKKPSLVGISEALGKRPTMEDMVSARIGVMDGATDVFGVFDGHGGRESATYVANNMCDEIVSRLAAEAAGGGGAELSSRKDVDVFSAIASSFEKLDEETTANSFDGTTAVVAILIKGKAWVGNVGDSRAVLCCEGVARDVTKDHKPTSKGERRRVNDLDGGYISNGRIQGIISCSRSIGDGRLKPYVTSTPDTFSFHVSPAHEFMLMGCDGVWDVLSSQEAVDIARKELEASGDSYKAACRVREQAYYRKSTDNISIMLVHLKKYQTVVRKNKSDIRKGDTIGHQRRKDESSPGISTSAPPKASPMDV